MIKRKALQDDVIKGDVKHECLDAGVPVEAGGMVEEAGRGDSESDVLQPCPSTAD